MVKLKPLFLSLSMVTSLAVAGCSNFSKENAGTTKSNGKETAAVKIAIDTAAGGSFQFRAAEKQGYFEKNSIKAQLSNFAYGIDTVNAVLTEQADTGLAADYALLNSLGKGDMVVISTLTRGNEKSSKDNELLVREGIKTENDLKGKKLGVPKGTVTEYVWAKYLAAKHINEKDISFVPYSTPDEAIVGMKNGDIDAVWSSGALKDKFKNIKGVTKLGDLESAGVTIDSYLLAKRSFVEKNPKAVENTLKALSEGIKYVDNNKKETAKLAFEQLKLPEKDALKDIERQNYVLGFTEEDAKHLEDMKVWLEEKGKLKDKYELKDKINLEALKKAFPESVTYK
ncbi:MULTISPECIES: ABC transporter substrate-binding protein [Bacillus cereus group]|uniref:ABC transporter substrate-binding protein n=1 Tax=Bacillus paranthracis TaxID=2026186 RepID=A0AAX3Q6N3_9BACI|nr:MULTISPECIES: ABC transporter substrate-binding protein [Bacillus cereus group]PKF95808.1 ABC transporter substrate-binding protein [Bacillus cereus]MBE7116394.1 ABC transporter substrate-binding protein [Bacillus paranthracis]MBE7134337.1 ABC transporter substrate-binding protein [Bacillus paranthracis]MBE7156510.1 ABC transporter substrate-binding protein [Bacillus paranthracis]MCU4851878.1 ABC transporter substrate-binding protein [Bacillus paranthracis]